MKTRWKILLAALVIGVIGLVLLTRESSYHRAARRYKEEMLSRGEKLDMAELAPKLTAKGTNAAALFLAFTNVWQKPTNALDGYEQNTQAMAKLRVIIEIGALDFYHDYSNGNIISLPEVTKFKQAERLATETALQALQKQDYPEAWVDLLASADLVRLQKGPFIISALVRAVNVNMAVPPDTDALESNSWSEAQLAELQHKWEGMDLFAEGEIGLAMESAGVIRGLAVARQSREKLNEFLANRNSPHGGDGTALGEMRAELKRWYERYPRYWAWKSTWSYAEELSYLQSIGAAQETHRAIVKSGAFHPAYDEVLPKLTNVFRRYADVTNHFILMPQESAEWAVTRLLTGTADAEVFRRMLVTAIALKRYQLRHGTYPNRLEDMTPEFLPGVPIDLMDGKPLRYRIQPDGDFLLYSIGLDGKDDWGNADSVWLRPVKATEVKKQ